jgi:two-component system response regulator FlrC
MREQVVAGKFREDLYYRLSVLPLQWAPLRDRLEDIIPLAQKILQKHAQKQNRHGVSLTMAAQQALLSYSWPGNVRELDNIMQRALILQIGSGIDAADLGLDAGNIYSQKPNLMEAAMHYQTHQPINSHTINSQAIHSAREFAQDLSVPHYSGDNIALISATPYVPNPALGTDLKQREYEIIMDTLRKEGGSRKNTAERLGISARTLRYKMARLREEGFAITE